MRTGVGPATLLAAELTAEAEALLARVGEVDGVDLLELATDKDEVGGDVDLTRDTLEQVDGLLNRDREGVLTELDARECHTIDRVLATVLAEQGHQSAVDVMHHQ